ncbi:translation initiation factor IF-3 [Patescibacteria group bacterium]
MRRRYKPRPKRQQLKAKYRTNEQIRVPFVLVIDESGNNLGKLATPEAVELAKSKGLDLVEVAPNTKPPTCKIADYGKFQYIQAKQSRQQKAKQKKTETKGIRLGVRTDSHDLGFKKKQAEKFLGKGHKVKVELRLRGREKAHQELAKNNLRSFVSSIEVPHKIEEDVKRFPGGFNIIIAPE